VKRSLDEQNAIFWNEPPGAALAEATGIRDLSPGGLRRFDDEYLALYPYLSAYVTREPLLDKRALEIGLGYGTLGQLIANEGALYHGIDIAETPVKVMRYRLRLMGADPQRVLRASALRIPYSADSFDYVFSVGCLHHVGDLEGACAEVFRVLRPNGKAVIMLYNANSARQLFAVRWARLQLLYRRFVKRERTRPFGEHVRAWYDANTSGEAPPHTDYVSVRSVRRLFRRFASVRVEQQNFDTLVFRGGRWVIPRERLLNNVARIFGLDLYITAVK